MVVGFLLVQLVACEGEVKSEETAIDSGDVPAEVELDEVQTFAVAWSSGELEAPRELGSIMVMYSELPDALVQVTQRDDGLLDLRFGVAQFGAPSEQDPCVATTDVEGASFDNPTFEGSSSTLTVTMPVLGELKASTEVVLEEVGFSGTFTDEGFVEGRVTYRLDVAPYGLSLHGGTAGSICEISAAFGEPCVPCDAGGPTCLEVVWSGLVGTSVDGASVEASDGECP